MQSSRTRVHFPRAPDQYRKKHFLVLFFALCLEALRQVILGGGTPQAHFAQHYILLLTMFEQSRSRVQENAFGVCTWRGVFLHTHAIPFIYSRFLDSLHGHHVTRALMMTSTDTLIGLTNAQHAKSRTRERDTPLILKTN